MAAVFVALAVALSACTTTTTATTTTTTATTATTASGGGIVSGAPGPPTRVARPGTGHAGSVAVSASSGCGTPASPGTTSFDLTVAGKHRIAVLHVPTGYHPSSAVPLVLNMHGSRSTAVEQEGFSGMDATSDADTFMVVYPQGALPAGSGFEWNVPGQPLFGGSAVPPGAADDVSYLEHLVRSLEQRYCIDRNRIYATGFSGGARMASQLGCDATAVIAAVAPVSGLRLPSPCPSTRPVAVLSFHGTADPVDPYGGDGQKYWTYSVPVAAQRWAVHDGCSPKAATSELVGGVSRTSYVNCSAGSSVQLYTITGEGHEWPGGPHLRRAITRVLGPQTTAIGANSTMWSFFVAHPL